MSTNQWQQQQQQQQQQQPQQPQQPQVIVIQQPVTIAGPARKCRCPHLYRGTHCLGCRWTCAGISPLATVGGVLLYMGFQFMMVEVAAAVIMVLIGIPMVVLACCICHKSRKEYNALPTDHPDRYKYLYPGSQVVQPGPGGTITYQLPAASQITTSDGQQMDGSPSPAQPVPYPSAPYAGQPATYPAPYGGQPATYPAPYGGQPATYPTPYGGQPATYPASYAGPPGPSAPLAPAANIEYRDSDPPPAYVDVVKDPR